MRSEKDFAQHRRCGKGGIGRLARSQSGVEHTMVTIKPQGQYRTEPISGRASMVYVIDRGTASYVTEAIYRLKGYTPEFEDLPTEDQYHA
jgi:hypothetical protein